MFEIESALSFSEKTVKFYGNDRTRMNKKLWILGRVCRGKSREGSAKKNHLLYIKI
jgi:hypothetical protein